jgi:hypothetical protein
MRKNIGTKKVSKNPSRTFEIHNNVIVGHSGAEWRNVLYMINEWMSMYLYDIADLASLVFEKCLIYRLF